jgi:hypothetical protein
MIKNKEISVDEIQDTYKIKQNEIYWRIEKIILERDEVFIRNLSTNLLYRYKMKGSVKKFLQDYNVEDYDQQDMWNFFEENASVYGVVSTDSFKSINS